MTTDEFIVKAQKVHGDTYLYQKTVYKNATSKVTITCRIHGDVDQVAYYHTNGNGCPTCGGTQRGTKAEFVATAKEKYDHKYDYSEFEYRNRKTKGKILCPDHGEFWQTPGGHLAPHVVCGCPKCGLETLGDAIRSSQEDFEAGARVKHGDKFAYGVYFDSRTPMTIECPKHGFFEMTPNDHLRTANGCGTWLGRAKRAESPAKHCLINQYVRF